MGDGGRGGNNTYNPRFAVAPDRDETQLRVTERRNQCVTRSNTLILNRDKDSRRCRHLDGWYGYTRRRFYGFCFRSNHII